MIDVQVLMRQRKLRTLDDDAVLDAARTHSHRMADVGLRALLAVAAADGST